LIPRSPESQPSNTSFALPKLPLLSENLNLTPAEKIRAISDIPLLTSHVEQDERSTESAPPVFITKRERMGGYLQTRDMRNLVMPFSPKNTPSLIVRRHVVLLNIDPLRGVVLRDRLLVLVPDGADSILSKCEARLRGGVKAMEKEVFGYDDDTESSDYQGRSNARTKQKKLQQQLSTVSDQSIYSQVSDSLNINASPYEVALDSALRGEDPILSVHNALHNLNPNEPLQSFPDSYPFDEFEDINQRNFLTQLPFELHAIDVLLEVATGMLLGEAWIVCDDAREVIGVLSGKDDSVRQSHRHYEALRLLRNEADEMKARLQGLSRALTDILSDDEDLSLMNLSRLVTHPERFLLPVSQEILNEESDEPELILESYQQQAQSALNSLNLVLDQMLTVRNHVEFELDRTQNRLIFIDTVLNAVTLVLSIATTTGAFLGMNVGTDPETGYIKEFVDKPNAFVNAIICVLFSCALMCMGIYVSVLHLSRRLI